MEILQNTNVISLVLILIFVLTVAAGAIREFSRNRVRRSVAALLECVEFLLGLYLSFSLTRKIFFEYDGKVYSGIYERLPEKIKAAALEQDMLVYVIAIPVLLFLMLLVIRLVTMPLYRYVLIPVADFIHSGVSLLGPLLKRVTGALWQVPKAIVMTIAFATILYFSMYYIYSPKLTEWASDSKEYQFIYSRVLYPAINSNIAKKIPVIIGDSFRKAAGGTIPAREANAVDKTIEKLSGGSIKIIHYFNGVTLDEAVRSNAEIDRKAADITSGAGNEKEKAYLLYKWIAKNIGYDYDKAERIAQSTEGEESGSIVAYDARRGICFDYSSLYVSMCRAVGLKVRFITGQGFSGAAWGDHAWNQVWDGAEKRWINVDTTFGSTGLNYFDRRNFSVDHKYAEVQEEW